MWLLPPALDPTATKYNALLGLLVLRHPQRTIARRHLVGAAATAYDAWVVESGYPAEVLEAYKFHAPIYNLQSLQGCNRINAYYSRKNGAAVFRVLQNVIATNQLQRVR